MQNIYTVDDAIKLYEQAKGIKRAEELKRFNKYLGNMLVSDLSLRNIIKFEDVLRKSASKNTDAYVYTFLRQIRYFIVFLETENIKTKVSSAEILKRDRDLYKKIKQYLSTYDMDYISEEDLVKLNDYWEKNTNYQTLISLRNRALFALYGYSGLRTVEALELKRNDYSNSNIHIKNRYIKLPRKASDLISKYLNQRPDDAPEMFVGYDHFDSEEMRTHPLGKARVREIIRDTAKDIGLDKQVNPQVLRNSLIIRMLIDDTVDQKELTEFLGVSYKNNTYRLLPQAKAVKGIGKDWLTAEETAKKYKISLDTLLRHIRNNKINHITFQKKHYISPKTAQEFSDKRKQNLREIKTVLK